MTRLLMLLIVAASFNAAFAEKNATLEPKLGSIGSPEFSDTFDSKLGDEYHAAKGEWQVSDGVLLGKELESDKHAAVLTVKKPNQNSVVRFSFKLDGETKGFNFSLNHKGGHLFRAIVTPSLLSVNLDKDKKDPKSKAKRLASAKGKFAQGEWYTMQIEMVGDRVIVQTDNGVSLDASDPKLDTKKPGYRFVMRDESISIDDLHVWSVN